MRPMRNSIALGRRRSRAATTVFAAMACFAFASTTLAQSAPESPFAAATAVVRDAAATAFVSARNLTSSALDLIGIRYKWGGTTPASGLDCSGLVQFVFQQVTGVTLPRSTKDLSRIGSVVALADLQPGDLVFFNTRRFAFSHVGIYVGDNRFIHAPRRGREVEVATIDKSYWQKHFNGARRLIGVLPDMMPKLIAEASASGPELQVAPETPAELAAESPATQP
jgi:cell wall-associated NlpC family hydrolase